jgi:hypothetical protein
VDFIWGTIAEFSVQPLDRQAERLPYKIYFSAPWPNISEPLQAWLEDRLGIRTETNFDRILHDGDWLCIPNPL